MSSQRFESLKTVDEIVLGRPYFYYEEDYPSGMRAVVFTRKESPHLVQGELSFVDGEKAEPIFILESELSSWSLKPTIIEDNHFKNSHVKVARIQAKRAQREWTDRLPFSAKVINKLKQFPDAIHDIKADLAKFRSWKNPMDSYWGSGVRFGIQSLPTFRPGVHDYVIKHKDGRLYALSLSSGYYLKNILKEYPDGEYLSVGTHTNAAWGAVLEWIDKVNL